MPRNTSTFGQLAPGVPVVGSDIFPIQRIDGINHRITVDELATFVGGLLSLNGDTTPAQVIAAGVGLDLVDAGALHTLSIDSTVVTLTGIQTLTNKTLTTPTIASFINATHSHLNAAGGGTITALAISDFDAEVSNNTSVVANTAKVTNATHTGDATGATALTLAPVAITGQTLKAVAVGADEVLISDSAAGGALKRTTVTQFLTDLAGITSINADVTAAQIIAAGTGISVGDAGGTHTISLNAASTDLTDSANLARNTDNLSFFAATTSLQLLGVISDETGSGLLVFGTNPTIVTPTIASFVNATHDHQAAAGGGTLLSTSALSDTADIAYLNTPNIFAAGNLNQFGHNVTDAGLRAVPFAGNPTTQNDGEIWYNLTTNTLFGRINGANVDLGAVGGGGDMVLADVQTVTGAKTFGTIGGAVGKFILAGSTSGSTIVNAAAVAGATTITFPGTTGTVVIIGLASQITIGTEVTGASTALTDTADIGYLNQANTFGAFLNSFVSSSMRIPLSATPTMAVDGDFAIDTTVTDFSHGVMKFFDGEEVGVVAMPIAQFTTPTDGNVVSYNATNDEFELVASGGGGSGLTAVKGADTTRTNTSTLADDPDLVITQPINTKKVYLVVFVKNALAAPDFKYAFTIPTGATCEFTSTEFSKAVEGVTTDATVSTSLINIDDRETKLMLTVTMGGTAGDINFQWAQVNSDAGATILRRGSFIKEMLVE